MADEVSITLKKSMFFGQTDSLDCPDFINCYCEDKFALMSFGNFENRKSLMPDDRS